MRQVLGPGALEKSGFFLIKDILQGVAAQCSLSAEPISPEISPGGLCEPSCFHWAMITIGLLVYRAGP